MKVKTKLSGQSEEIMEKIQDIKVLFQQTEKEQWNALFLR